MNSQFDCQFCITKIHTSGNPLKKSYTCQQTKKQVDPITCALCDKFKSVFDLEERFKREVDSL